MAERSDDLATRLAAVEDQLAIQALLVAYADAVDERDIDAVAACFADDARATYAGVDAGEGGRPIAEFIVNSMSAIPGPTSHLIVNMSVQLQGDRATARCRALVCGGARTEPDSFRLRSVTYRDAVVRTADGWRIAQREHSAAWEASADNVPVTAIPPTALRRALRQLERNC